MCGTDARQALIFWCLAALSGAFATCLPESLALDVSLAGEGEWWRLLSGHLVHITWRHYLYDLPALGLSLYLYSRLEERFRPIAFTALCSACAVSATLLVAHPVDVYGGVSGITAGLLSFVVLRLIARGAWGGGSVLLAGMLLKIFLERRGVTASGVNPVWHAHCAGAAAGLIVAALSLGRNRPAAGEGDEISLLTEKCD